MKLKGLSQLWNDKKAYFIPRLPLCQTWVHWCLWIHKCYLVGDSNQLGLLQQWLFVQMQNMNECIFKSSELYWKVQSREVQEMVVTFFLAYLQEAS